MTQSRAPTANELARALGDRIEVLARHHLGDPNPAHSTRTEWRYGKKGSFSVIVAGNKKGSAYDYEKHEGGDALWLAQRCLGTSVRGAMDWAIEWMGGRIEARPDPVRTRAPIAYRNSEKDYADIAMKTWGECFEISGTLVETYLRQRRAWPSVPLHDLRFHPQCPFKVAGELVRAPAMIGLMRNIKTNKPQGIHRTALLPDGSGRNHDIGKKMLGPKEGAAIMLTPYEDVTTGLSIAEGLENSATMMCHGWVPMWCALDAGCMQVFPVIDGVEHLNIFTDADDRGTGIEAGRICADRWSRDNRRATIHAPPAGKDWNQVAQERAA